MSTDTLLKPYLSLSEKQIIPEFTKFHNPTRQSIILDRNTTAYPPTSGQSYTVQGAGAGQSNQISWLISDASRFLDLPTASLLFDYTLNLSSTPAVGPALILPSDNAVSLFSRIQIKLGGILIEDILDLNKYFNAKMVTNMNKDFYDNNMNILAGSWVWNQNYGGSNVIAADLATRFQNAEYADYQPVPASAANGPSSNSRSFAIPLSFISGLFAMQKTLPLPMMNTLEINLYMDSLSNSHYSTTANANTAILPNVSFTLSNVRIQSDMLEMNASYCQLIKQIAYNDEAGLNLALDTAQSFNLSYSGSVSASQQQLAFNKASPFVRSVLCSKTNPANLNNLNQLGLCNFLNNGNAGVRISVGSIYNPVYGDTQNNATTYAVTRSGDVNNVVAGSIQNACTYSGAILPNNNAASGTSRDGPLTNFTFGFNFDKVISSLVDADGLDTGALGSALQLYIKENGTTPSSATLNPSTISGQMVLNVYICYTRHIQMKGGVISVSG
jgi:hypothetical protein